MRPTVAGWGAVSALGVGVDPLLAGVYAGRSGLRPRVRLAAVDCPAEVAGELPEELWQARPEAAELALHAAELAAREACPPERLPEPDLALVLSTTKGAPAGLLDLVAGRPPRSSPAQGGPPELLQRLAARLGCTGPRIALSCACCSGLSALALAGRWLRGGRARRALVVGVDVLTPFVLRGFASLLALDRGPCRPFDRARRGLSLGEGAGALLLSAEADEGDVELAGWGESNDANHITGPSRAGAGLRLAAQRALARAGETPAGVDLIHLHGTGTRYNDAAEARALVSLCGGSTPPAVGTKAHTGHALGATGILESIVAVAALRRSAAPGNLGLEEADVDPGLRLPRASFPLPSARCALKLAAGFGGINAALLFRTR